MTADADDLDANRARRERITSLIAGKKAPKEEPKPSVASTLHTRARRERTAPEAAPPGAAPKPRAAAKPSRARPRAPDETS